mgnify:CR=1 FL=1
MKKLNNGQSILFLILYNKGGIEPLGNERKDYYEKCQD